MLNMCCNQICDYELTKIVGNTGQKDAFTSDLKSKRLWETKRKLSQTAPVPDLSEGPGRVKQGSGTLAEARLLPVLIQLEHCIKQKY